MPKVQNSSSISGHELFSVWCRLHNSKFNKISKAFISKNINYAITSR